MSEVNLTSKNYSEEVEKSTIPVLIDFWATWCGPCRMLTPVLEKINEENGYAIGKINVDEEEELALAFSVQAIPTLILFKDGKLTDKKVGYLPQNELVKWIKTYE